MSAEHGHGDQKPKSGPPWGILAFIVALGFLLPMFIGNLASAIASAIAILMNMFRQYFGTFLMIAALFAAFKWVATWMGAKKPSNEDEHH